ncbi:MULTISPECIES: ribose ABC transporter permease [unclassified Sedimentibacter]|uniref:ribose ABC transporter permease n=1 Tax=unclassified Sedimentibacter TaxID=2649220 RepID=UPI0027E0307A|nr:ribose ABC transporter permease [Sedimentibacter sp. MB35-C1]WMJ78929.1 ribose ABC transporter permease [Sedimentibacter sp. MB35-C1]
MNKLLKKLLKNKPLIVLLITSIIVAILNPRFLTWGNILTVLRQTSINAVIATGMTFAILIGGIDLSVGSVLGICGAVAAAMISSGTNVFIAVIVVLLLGTFIGFLNGTLITAGRLQPFIATLGTVTLLRGIILVFTQGRPISTGSTEASEAFGEIGSGFIGPIPIPVYIMILVFIIAYYILNHTRIGRYIYATGSNEEATIYSGIKTNRVKLFVYSASGMMAALAGILITARLGSAQPTAGAGYELDAIAAVVLGGTSMAGGIGTIAGTAIGALIIGVLNNALNLMQVSSYYQDVAKGIVILAAVLLDRKQKLSR